MAVAPHNSMSRAFFLVPLLVVLVLLAASAAAATAQQTSRLRGRSLAAFNTLEKNVTRPVKTPLDDMKKNGEGSGNNGNNGNGGGATGADDQEAADEADATLSTDDVGDENEQSGDNGSSDHDNNHDDEHAQSSQPTPTPPPSDGCPTSPDVCSFVFKGYEDSIPVFPLPKTADSPIGPTIEGNVKGSSIVVRTLNSKDAVYPCTKKSGMEKLKDQFYAVNDVIQVRTIQSEDDRKKLSGEIVKVRISGAAIDVFNELFNLNPGDGSTSFPEEKRCVVFQVA
ncbi:unnamed protein product [Closterium sp. Yama58-4]|nr:unnamed protein product [Closterium sp. Yama58-4]